MRSWQVRRWIACRTAFRGRHRELLQPHSWTELFFLDEATAFAAGHRPCAECRNADYQRFKAAWAVGSWDSRMALMRWIQSCMPTGWRAAARTSASAPIGSRLAKLPDGAFIHLDGSAWLLWRGQLLEWSAGGYRRRRLPLPASSPVEVLMPRSLVTVLRSGYQLEAHVSAEEHA